MSWEEIDADYVQGVGPRTYYGVATREDYTFTPEALFLTEEAARAWVEWQQSLWTEEEEKGISPHADVYVMAVRDLRGKFWNSYEAVPGA